MMTSQTLISWNFVWTDATCNNDFAGERIREERRQLMEEEEGNLLVNEKGRLQWKNQLSSSQ
jgi:hypothetical protein